MTPTDVFYVAERRWGPQKSRGPGKTFPLRSLSMGLVATIV